MIWALTDPFPHQVILNGKPYEVETDYRLFVAFEREVFLETWHPDQTLHAFYRGTIPEDFELALEGFLAFYRAPREVVVPNGEESQGGETNRGAFFDADRPYSFADDDRRIYAAFAHRYGIRLQECRMHWAEFCALFSGLYEPSFDQIVGYRMMDLSALSGKTRARLAAVKQNWRIGKAGSVTLKQRNDAWVSLVRRYQQPKKEGG